MEFYTQAWHGFKPIGLLIIMVLKAVFKYIGWVR